MRELTDAFTAAIHAIRPKVVSTTRDHVRWRVFEQAMTCCIPTCIPACRIELQATDYMERTSLPRAPKLRKVLLCKAFFFVCGKVGCWVFVSRGRRSLPSTTAPRVRRRQIRRPSTAPTRRQQAHQRDAQENLQQWLWLWLRLYDMGLGEEAGRLNVPQVLPQPTPYRDRSVHKTFGFKAYRRFPSRCTRIRIAANEPAPYRTAVETNCVL